MEALSRTHGDLTSGVMVTLMMAGPRIYAAKLIRGDVCQDAEVFTLNLLSRVKYLPSFYGQSAGSNQ